MKYILICMSIIITGCHVQQTKNNLNGVFTALSETEFGITDDTLLVSRPNTGENIYQIERHSGVIKKLDGKVFPKEIKIVTWTLEFDPVKQTLFELKGGKPWFGMMRIKL